MSDLRLAVLGDSIAHGQGAATPAHAPGPRLVAVLAAAGHPTQLRVVAVPGARSSGLDVQVTRALAWSPDIAVVIIGANDLARFVPPDQAAAQLERALRRLTTAGVETVVAPAPDLSVVPWVPAPLRAAVRAASAGLRAAQARAVAAAGGHLADGDAGTSAAFARDPSLFSPDQFHPSSAGYAVIADALAPTVLRAAARLAGRRAG